MSQTAGRPAWPLFVGLAAAIVAADQLAKAWLTSTLQPGESTRVVDDLVRFVFLQGNAPVFAVLSIVVVGLIVAYHARAGRDVLLSVTLGLLLGGALGNLVDRIRLGYVVDFVDAGVGDLRWYTFNVADASISCAIVLLVLLALRPAAPPAAPGAQPD
jgi:signal peptidase II